MTQHPDRKGLRPSGSGVHAARKRLVGVLAAAAERPIGHVRMDKTETSLVAVEWYREAIRNACDSHDIVTYEDTVRDPGVFRGTITCDDMPYVNVFVFSLMADMLPDLVLEVVVPCLVKPERRADVALLCSLHTSRRVPCCFFVCPHNGNVTLRITSHISSLSVDAAAEIERLVETAKFVLEEFMPEFFEVIGIQKDGHRCFKPSSSNRTDTL